MGIFEQAQNDDPGTTPDGASGEHRIVTICKHLFRLFAEDHDLDTDEMRQVKIKEFVPWCNEHEDLWFSEEAREKLCRSLNVLEDDLQAVWTVFQNPYDACALLYPIWFMLSLSGQRPISHVPGLLDVSVAMGWAARSSTAKAFRIRIPTRIKPDSKMTSGFICALLRDQFDDLLRTIAGRGVDDLYEKEAMLLGISDSDATPRKLKPGEQAKGCGGL